MTAKDESKVCLTFDIEDWFQVQNYRSFFPLAKWDNQNLRVEIGTEIILDLLAKHKVKATFFVLGWIAQRLPQLVNRIADQGHEIASHGYNHMLNSALTREELREDLRSSKALLEDITGKEIIGYRAPTFSISEEVLDMLAELDYQYDSSLNSFSLINDNYGAIHSGGKESGRFVHERTGITEFPLPVLTLAGIKIPIAGGGYFRLFPYPVYRRLFDRYRQEHEIFVFYMHPWEFDAGQPEVAGLKWSYRFRQRVAIESAPRKLELFIRENSGRFATLAEAVQGKDETKRPATETA